MGKNAILAVNIEKLDMQALARVAQWRALEDIYLVDAKISRSAIIELPEDLSLEHKCETNILFEKEKPNINKIFCNFRVAAFSSASPDKLVMKIEASFCTSYVYQGKYPYDNFDDELEYWFNICPISDAWPYWREFVQSMSTRMGFPALAVPLLEIVPQKSLGKGTKGQPGKKKSPRRKKANT
jgi:hypothetical protein